MKFPFSKVIEIKKLGAKFSGSRIRLDRDTKLLYGLEGVFLIFAACTLWAGFVFYTRVFARPTHDINVSSSESGFSQKSVDEVIQLLDARAAQLEKILEGRKDTPATAATTSGAAPSL